jgi:peroxiredoxin
LEIDKIYNRPARPTTVSTGVVSVIASGTQAPSFRLQREDGQRFTEQDLRDGHRTILVFYPFAFSSVCTDQLQVYEQALGELTADGTEIYGVSCDSSYAQKAFREQLHVSIPQLSDFEPKGAACAAFGVLHEGGFAQRALVIVDPHGTVRWSYQAPSPAELPGVELLREGLTAVAADDV